MIVKNVSETKDVKIESYPYKSKSYPVNNTWIRWLSQAGQEGARNYGLRLFTVGPKGSIPIHNHRYYQTMYILTGFLVVISHNPDTDEPTEIKKVGRDDVVFLPSMEPHSATNPSETEKCTFLCCIGNPIEDGIL